MDKVRLELPLLLQLLQVMGERVAVVVAKVQLERLALTEEAAPGAVVGTLLVVQVVALSALFGVQAAPFPQPTQETCNHVDQYANPSCLPAAP